MPDSIVQALWIGKHLSVMEQLSIRSYLDNGHPFHLYAYEDVNGVPSGVVVQSGDEILPEGHIFSIQRGYGKGNFATFSDTFRYKLLLERGGWWTDLDAVCMRPLDFTDEHVMGKMRLRRGRVQVACGMMKAPVGSRIMEYCCEACRKVGRSVRFWGQIGPMLITEAVGKVNAPVRLLEPASFYPIDYWKIWQMVRRREMPTECYALHLWHSAWLVQRLDPNAVYNSQCIYEQLKRRYNVSSPPGAARGPGWPSIARYWLGKLGMSGLP